MESNKYYTPDPNELYIGFEYEVQDELVWDRNNEFRNKKDFLGHLIIDRYKKFNFGWFPKVYDGSESLEYQIQYMCINDILEPKLRSYRVKYLDKEDIESLGWKYKKEKASYPTMFFNNWMLKPDGDMYELKSNSYLHYYGPIKNKSELRKLMNQLGIE